MEEEWSKLAMVEMISGYIASFSQWRTSGNDFFDLLLPLFSFLFFPNMEEELYYLMEWMQYKQSDSENKMDTSE